MDLSALAEQVAADIAVIKAEVKAIRQLMGQNEPEEPPDDPEEPEEPEDPPEEPPEEPSTPTIWEVVKEGITVKSRSDRKRVQLPKHSDCVYRVKFRCKGKNAGRILSGAGSSFSGFDAMSFGGKLCIGTDRGKRTFERAIAGNIHNLTSDKDHWLECTRNISSGDNDLYITIKKQRIAVELNGYVIGAAALRSGYSGGDLTVGNSGYSGDDRDRSQPGTYDFFFRRL